MQETHDPKQDSLPAADADTMAELAAMMAELDTHDSMNLTDSAVSMISGAASETDSAIMAAQLESEMVKSLGKLAEHEGRGESQEKS